MILVWDNAKSFQRHLEDMGRFRRSHGDREGVGGSLHDMPALFDVDPADNPGRRAALTRVRGRLIIAPLWAVAPPEGSQN